MHAGEGKKGILRRDGDTKRDNPVSEREKEILKKETRGEEMILSKKEREILKGERDTRRDNPVQEIKRFRGEIET